MRIDVLFFNFKTFNMKNSRKFVKLKVKVIFTLLCTLLIFNSCQKNAELDTKAVLDSGKSNVVEQLKDFTKRMKEFKLGKLQNRDDVTMTPSQLRDSVEGSFNLDYGYYKIYHGKYEMQSDTFDYTISGGVLSEAQQATFYDDAKSFISDHFGAIEGEDKLGVGYDVEVLSSSSNSVEFEVTSLVGADDEGSTSWGSGDDYHSMINKKCDNSASYCAPIILAAAATKYLGGTSSSGSFKILLCHADFMNYGDLWRFGCWDGNPNDPNRCGAILCSSLTNQEIQDAFCIDHNEMNDYLDYIESDLIPDFTCNQKSFLSMTMLPTAELCSGYLNGQWYGSIMYGLGPYTRIDYLDPPYRTP